MADWRPALHVTPKTGWLNDPNGLFLGKQSYHVFHQHHVGKPTWGVAQWEHLSSPDLVRWTSHAPALVPSAGPDADGCWSGCVVEGPEGLTAVYTGVMRSGSQMHESVCLAISDNDSLTSWRKHPKNPVVAGPPPELSSVGFRDPFVWLDGDQWAMILGGGIEGEGGVLFLYRSSNLVQWRYEGLVFRARDVGSEVWTGRVWECPQLVPLGDRHLLVFSVQDDRLPQLLHYAVAAVGRFDGRRFHPETLTRFDHGADCYAPALLVEPAGRVLSWAWSWEALSEKAIARQGWAGCLTFPRELRLLPSGTLGIAPAPEVLALRRENRVAAPTSLGMTRGNSQTLRVGSSTDLEACLQLGTARRAGLAVRASPDLGEVTRIIYDRVDGTVCVDRRCSSTSADARSGVHGGSLTLSRDEPLRLRVIVDRTILEVFANDRLALTERIYPTRDDSAGVFAFAEEGSAVLEQLVIWDLRQEA